MKQILWFRYTLLKLTVSLPLKNAVKGWFPRDPGSPSENGFRLYPFDFGGKRPIFRGELLVFERVLGCFSSFQDAHCRMWRVKVLVSDPPKSGIPKKVTLPSWWGLHPEIYRYLPYCYLKGFNCFRCYISWPPQKNLAQNVETKKNPQEFKKQKTAGPLEEGWTRSKPNPYPLVN